ncbi:MAG TPA: hypothetical protein VIT23_12145, partial [Terrimicrobiaceae bacterium]
RVSELSEAYLGSQKLQTPIPGVFGRSAGQRKAGELISKDLVIRQAQYIFICLRQAILNFPIHYARRVVGIADEHQAKAVLTKAAHEFLTELADFSEKAIDPNWMKTLEADGPGEGDEPRIRPSSGQQIKAEQKKAKIRRRKKTDDAKTSRQRLKSSGSSQSCTMSRHARTFAKASSRSRLWPSGVFFKTSRIARWDGDFMALEV